MVAANCSGCGVSLGDRFPDSFCGFATAEGRDGRSGVFNAAGLGIRCLDTKPVGGCDCDEEPGEGR